MFSISVEETFSSGHALRGYRGKCENPHGHNYRVRVRLQGPRLNGIGLLYDFKDLKGFIRRETEQWDHQYLNDLEPFREQNPSAENMARELFERLQKSLTGNAEGVVVESVTVFETDTTAAVYNGE
ncbi:MAG: 6-carboxytetrahydropterin synthase QueD [Acidobacteria bacterium]|nr:MAG: 6-carboxytetrahydropterin synthase QueD [Acidobacteriota bacterium]